MAAAPTQLSYEPISGNSLDQFIRAIEGVTGSQGQQSFGLGQQVFGQGVTAMAPALQFLTALTKGDYGDVTQAAQPQIDQITQQFDAIRNMISMQPRGGGKTSALAEAPFQKSAAIAKTEGSMRTGAAGQLGGLASNLANLGLSETSVGTGLESEAANIALTKQGLDYSQPSALKQLLEGLDFARQGAETGAEIASLI
jgi:hypothetical protein